MQSLNKKAMEFFYKKEADLDKENNFTIDISNNNNIDGQHFNPEEKYVILGLELVPQEVDQTRWIEFARHRINRINEAKKKKENQIKHRQILVYLPNFYNFTPDLLLAPELPHKIHKYINLKIKT